MTPDDFKRPFSRKRNKMSIAAKERNVLRIRFPSLVQSLGQRERLCALFYSTRHCPSQLGTINKVIWSPGKTLFLDLKVGKRHIGPKNNSKQLLFYWCYTHFGPFTRFGRFLVSERRFLRFAGHGLHFVFHYLIKLVEKMLTCQNL